MGSYEDGANGGEAHHMMHSQGHSGQGHSAQGHSGQSQGHGGQSELGQYGADQFGEASNLISEEYDYYEDDEESLRQYAGQFQGMIFFGMNGLISNKNQFSMSIPFLLVIILFHWLYSILVYKKSCK